MRIEGGYNFYARDCVKHFTLIISLNIFNIIIQFIPKLEQTLRFKLFCLP